MHLPDQTLLNDFVDKFLTNNLNHVEQTEAALAHGFAKRLSALATHLGATTANSELLRQVAIEISCATSAGHVCIPLAPLAAQLNHTLLNIQANLLATGVVCDGCAADAELLPLVLDAENRLYLARYYAYERRLAQALIRHAETTPADAANALFKKQESPSALETSLPLYKQLARCFKAPLNGQEIDIQQVATALALSNSLTIISGGPGTGKTTTVVGMLACLLDTNPTLRIALAAPTGRAAQRLAQALALNAHHLPSALVARLPRTASTLHRLLGNPHLRSNLSQIRAASLPYDVVIVDEASMLDITLAVQLMEALAPTTKLILLGDKNQLSAVEAGAVFAELSAQPSWTQPYLKQLASALNLDQTQLSAALPTASDAISRSQSQPESTSTPLANCVIWLERNYRFASDSAIGRLSRAINTGATAEMLAVLDEQIKEQTKAQANEQSAEIVFLEDAEMGLSDQTLARLAAGFEPYIKALVDVLRHVAETDAPFDCTPLFAALNRYRVLSAMRDGLRGVDRLNTLLTLSIRQVLNTYTKAHTKRIDPLALAFSYPNDAWFVGRPVMIMRNDYALELFNGDIGIALPYGKKALRVVFPTPQGGWRWFSPATLPLHETAFAMTVHKSQGSEFACAALVLPATPTRTLTRALLYTAVTRARSQVVLVGTPTILTDAVANPAHRYSGLSARLQEIAAQKDNKKALNK